MLKSALIVAGATAAMSFMPGATANAQDGITIKCSDVFGAGTQGIIVFTRGGTPNVFTCAGGPFPDRGEFSQQNLPCSQLFGPETSGRIVFTKGGVSVFSCHGGPFTT